jgi:hypothetical protein
MVAHMNENFAMLMESEGYTDVRLLESGEWAGLRKFIYTTGLVVGLDRTGYRTRFCYQHTDEARAALEVWTGSGDPPGPWLVRKGEGGDYRNPMMFRDIAVMVEK